MRYRMVALKMRSASLAFFHSLSFLSTLTAAYLPDCVQLSIILAFFATPSFIPAHCYTKKSKYTINPLSYYTYKLVV